jgi:hypothetical protein
MDEHRKHPREDIYQAIMVSPNGHQHRAQVLNLSLSGARVGLPDDFNRAVGAELKLYFPIEDEETVMLRGHVVRVAVDHVGVEFNPAQEDDIRYVMQRIPR